jgi:hypothetical protein
LDRQAGLEYLASFNAVGSSSSSSARRRRRLLHGDGEMCGTDFPFLSFFFDKMEQKETAGDFLFVFLSLNRNETRMLYICPVFGSCYSIFREKN